MNDKFDTLWKNTGIVLIVWLFCLSQLSMDHGGGGLFPVVYDDTVDDFDEEVGYF